MKKIAVTSEGPSLQSMIDPRFGRAPGFVVVDLDTMEHQFIDNGPSQTMAHGAGIQAARAVADAGAQVVLTGRVGPKAFEALKAAGIRVVQDFDNIKVEDAVKKFKSGSVDFAEQAGR